MTYEWAGRSFTGTVSEPVAPAGTTLLVRLDPESPTRVWSTTQRDPPGTDDGALAGFAMIVGLCMLGASALMLVNLRRPGST